jgi:hypothetical protein
MNIRVIVLLILSLIIPNNIFGQGLLINKHLSKAFMELNGLDAVGTDTGELVGLPTRYYEISKIFIKHAKERDINILLANKNPIIKAMGLICLANNKDISINIRLYNYVNSTEKVQLQLGCVVGESTLGILAKHLIDDPKYLGNK